MNYIGLFLVALNLGLIVGTFVVAFAEVFARRPAFKRRAVK